MSKRHKLCLSAILVAKSISTKLWYDSPHLFCQLPRVGPATSQAFIDANYKKFQEVEELSSFEIQSVKTSLDHYYYYSAYVMDLNVE